MKAVVTIILLVNAVVAKPKDESSRIHDGKLSNKQHFSASGEHNTEYDHDAFLGSQKKEFDELTPLESEKRLVKLIDRIDKDGDTKLSRDELKEWIRFASKRWMYDDSERLWKHFKRLETHLLRTKGDNPDPKAVANPETPISWDLWKKDSFGDEISTDEEPNFRRDRKRWEQADTDKDDKISKKEFTAFIHPHQFDHMTDVVVSESLLDIDTNKDGYISLNEYLDDITKRAKRENFNSESEKQEHIKLEKESFLTAHDKDKDGRLNRLTKIGRR